MEGCIESLYEDWAKQEALSIEALSLEKLLMPTFFEISHDGIDLPSVRSYAGVSGLLTCPMKTQAASGMPSMLLVPQQQSISAGLTESESIESGDEDYAGLLPSRATGSKCSSQKAAFKRSRLEFEASMTGVLQPFDAVKNYGTGRLSLQQLNAKIKAKAEAARSKA
ncbi:hypothetical protein OEZ86_006272 [Tetradesmus obliquus]|nr:hypothetical protein OEZ86_006272 [Tetradesmus obliquus]